jgi:multiple sugar transport system permease protein
VRLRALVGRRLGQIVLLITMVCLLFPVYWLVQSSVSTQNELFHTPSYVFPPHPSLTGFRQALPVIAPDLGNSAIIAGGTVLLTLLITVTTGYGLLLSRVGAGGALVRFLVLMGLVFPAIMFVIPLYQVFDKLHLLNSYLGLILADSLYSVPLGILIMYTYMLTLPPSFTEAARVDGASRGRVLWSVVFPLSRPAAATTAIFAFLGAWGDYLFAATFTSGGSRSPASTGVYAMITANAAVSWPEVMAASVVLGLPTVLALVLAQRYIRTGLNAGGLVG